MNKDPFDYIQPCAVSLGLKGFTPIGSGTLIQFSISRSQVYAVLTATHVLEELGIFSDIKSTFKSIPNNIVLSKPIDRDGNVRGILLSKFGFYTEVDSKHYRHLREKHPQIYAHSERDVAILILSEGKLISNDLIDHSNFFDLDINQSSTALETPYNAIFYKGACTTEEEINNVLTNTGIRFSKCETIKNTPKAKIPYIVSTVMTNEFYDKKSDANLQGGSGAALWLFCKTQSGIQQRIHGVIIESLGRSRMKAIDISYIYNDFLPKFKNMVFKT